MRKKWAGQQFSILHLYFHAGVHFEFVDAALTCIGEVATVLCVALPACREQQWKSPFDEDGDDGGVMVVVEVMVVMMLVMVIMMMVMVTMKV